MKLSAQTQAKFENFFRHFFDDPELSLPASNIYTKRGAGFVTKILGVQGITIGRHIFINPILSEVVAKNSLKIGKNLLAHELTHVLQYQKMGLTGFLVGYVKEYLNGLKRRKKFNTQARREAYWEISHEIEARQAAAKFIEWNRQTEK
jgi:hypothetical protein